MAVPTPDIFRGRVVAKRHIADDTIDPETKKPYEGMTGKNFKPGDVIEGWTKEKIDRAVAAGIVEVQGRI